VEIRGSTLVKRQARSKVVTQNQRTGVEVAARTRTVPHGEQTTLRFLHVHGSFASPFAGINAFPLSGINEVKRNFGELRIDLRSFLVGIRRERGHPIQGPFTGVVQRALPFVSPTLAPAAYASHVGGLTGTDVNGETARSGVATEHGRVPGAPERASQKRQHSGRRPKLDPDLRPDRHTGVSVTRYKTVAGTEDGETGAAEQKDVDVMPEENFQLMARKRLHPKGGSSGQPYLPKTPMRDSQLSSRTVNDGSQKNLFEGRLFHLMRRESGSMEGVARAKEVEAS
jgi:hypothetical protein